MNKRQSLHTQSKLDFIKFIKKNPTRYNNVSKFYYSIFIWSSTCFGRHTARNMLSFIYIWNNKMLIHCCILLDFSLWIVLWWTDPRTSSKLDYVYFEVQTRNSRKSILFHHSLKCFFMNKLCLQKLINQLLW
jgi:hypothetical protein